MERVLRRTPVRPGFAVLAALLALALAMALVLAATLRVEEDARVARSETLQQRASAAAERALWGAVATADPHLLRAEQVGTVTTATTVFGGVTTTTTVTRVDTPLVWIVASAVATLGRETAQRRVGVTSILPQDTVYSPLRPIPGRAWVELF